MRQILFHRNFDQYSGGQQKVLDYFEHCAARDDVAGRIFWAAGSQDFESTVWSDHQSRRVDEYAPADYDAVFLAGMDWQAYLPRRPRDGTQPVINLIQHVRHADPSANVYPFLEERALRICVSREVEQAIQATGRVNGPTFAIPNGIDLDALIERRRRKTPGSVYILGNKQPELARELEGQLREKGIQVTCHAEHVSRDAVLTGLAEADIAVLLPHRTEGFYLPPLEAMALGALAVVPDCVGNRGFCRDEETCLMPEPDVDALLDAVIKATSMLGSDAGKALRDRAQVVLANHTLARERDAFHRILDKLDALWSADA